MLIYDHIPSKSSNSFDSKESSNNNSNNIRNNNNITSTTKFSAKLQNNIAEMVIQDNLEFVNFGNLIELAHLNFTSEFLQFCFEHTK